MRTCPMQAGITQIEFVQFAAKALNAQRREIRANHLL
jgi:hypothetical protein